MCKLNPLLTGGLYVHTPFCETKCGYCDFYSVPLKDRETAPLVDRLMREIRTRVAAAPVRVRTIFCGGGTPTILPDDELDALLSTIRDVTSYAVIEDFTVEANPDTVTETNAALLVRNGVTRVSMGAQSFFPDELTALERLHSPEDIPPAIGRLRAAGIGDLNLDLIFGIQGQTMETWSQSLQRAMDLGVDHIACYALTYEPNTRLTARLTAGTIAAIDESLEADMYEHAVETLEAAGYRQYEISNFARPGRESKHNLVYWRNEPYIGCGPSAAGCYGGVRYKNVADVARYVQAIDERGEAMADREELSREALIMETVMMQLRLNEGIDRDRFRAAFGEDACELFSPRVGRMEELGLLTVSDRAIALTGRGRLVSDAVIAELACADSGTDMPLTVLRG